jgi:hypothetical protein
MAETNEGSPSAPVTEGQRQQAADVAKGQRPANGQRGQHPVPGRERGGAEWPPSVPELQAPPVAAPPPQQAQVQTGQSASSEG